MMMMYSVRMCLPLCEMHIFTHVYKCKKNHAPLAHKSYIHVHIFICMCDVMIVRRSVQRSFVGQPALSMSYTYARIAYMASKCVCVVWCACSIVVYKCTCCTHSCMLKRVAREMCNILFNASAADGHFRIYRYAIACAPTRRRRRCFFRR